MEVNDLTVTFQQPIVNMATSRGNSCISLCPLTMNHKYLRTTFTLSHERKSWYSEVLFLYSSIGSQVWWCGYKLAGSGGLTCFTSFTKISLRIFNKTVPSWVARAETLLHPTWAGALLCHAHFPWKGHSESRSLRQLPRVGLGTVTGFN